MKPRAGEDARQADRYESGGRCGRGGSLPQALPRAAARTGAKPKAAKFMIEATTNNVVPIQNSLLCVSEPVLVRCASPSACRLFPTLIPIEAEIPRMIPRMYVHTSGSLFSWAPQEVKLPNGADGGAASVPNVADAIRGPPSSRQRLDTLSGEQATRGDVEGVQQLASLASGERLRSGVGYGLKPDGVNFLRVMMMMVNGEG